MAIEKRESKRDTINEEPEGKFEIVETPAGKFRIIYNFHTGFYNAEQPVSDMGSNYAAAVFEMPWDVETIQGSFNSAPAFRAIVERLAEERKPIFVTDINALGTLLSYQYGIVAAEVATLYGLTKDRKNTKPKTEVTRRNFLSKAGRALAGAFLTTEVLSAVLIRGSHIVAGSPNAVARNVERGLELVHPRDMYVLKFRNLINAEKMIKIREENKTKFADEELLAVFGDRHIGLLDALKMSRAERVKEIRSLAKILPQPFTSREDLARVLRLDFDKSRNGWSMRETFDKDILATFQ